MEKLYSRRQILSSTLRTGAGITLFAGLGPALLSACKNCSTQSNSTTSEQAAAEVVPCSGQENLSEQEKTVRSTLSYVDSSPLPARNCANCKLYTLAMNKASCGGCKVVPGPIHPKGYCTAWLHLM